MSGAIENENEHRRGLVLGLTLAEILLLMLFLVLLALGSRLKLIESQLNESKEDLAIAVNYLNQNVSSVVDGTSKEVDILQKLTELKDAQQKIIKREKENAHLQSILSGVKRKTEIYDALITEANLVDPESAPEILEFAKNALRSLDKKLSDKVLLEISEVSSVLSGLQRKLTAEEKGALPNALRNVLSGDKVAGHSWPPIIPLKDADGYSFRIGSAEIEKQFEIKLQEKVLPEILKIANQYQVYVVEVVGHTDEQPISPKPSNLDKQLFLVLNDTEPVSTLIPGDNAGLGLTRAIAVVESLKRDHRLDKFHILPLSGGQLIKNDETLSLGDSGGDVRQRRRIEIRLRKGK